MNVSFLGISIKSPHDLYSWNRIKGTLLVNWYTSWRYILIVLGVILLPLTILTIILLLQGYTQESINQLFRAPLSQTILVVFLGFIGARISYKALFCKRFKTFTLLLKENQKPQFLSWYVVKRYAIFLLICYLPYLALGITTMSHYVVLSFSLLTSHICLHCGFWGVRFEPKHLNNQNHKPL
jgi:hypothetical protein